MSRRNNETASWPQARARISGAKITSDDSPQTTETQIAKICAMMDKQDKAQEFGNKQGPSDPKLYKLPKLPPSGMRYQQKNRWHRPMIRNIVKPH